MTGRKTSGGKTSGARTRKSPTTRSRSTRRKPSTATTLGGLVGAAVAGLITASVEHLPWWVWLVLVVVGLGVGYVVHRARRRSA